MTGVAHQEWGSGPPLVCLHGIGSASDSFAGVASILGDHRVIAWDMPGYGRSADLDVDWPDASDYADALLRFLDTVALQPVHLLGHSLGCLIAARFACRHPARVTGLTLASPALGHGVAPPAISDAVRTRLDSFEREGADAFAATRAPRLLAQPKNTANLSVVQRQMAGLRAQGHRAAAGLLSGGDLLADAAALTVPTDVVVGAQDGITPPDNARRLFDTLSARSRGTFTLIPDAGHALATEAPGALAATLIEPHHA